MAMQTLPSLIVLFCLFTGTESETRAFMAVCIEAIKKQDLTDLKTPQFIFERLANIIYPVSLTVFNRSVVEGIKLSLLQQ